MTKADWASLGFYSLLFVFAFLSFASQDMDMMILLAVLVMATAAVNGARTVLRSRQRDDDWEDEWDATRQFEPEDEMDVHRVLDLDQRLEALERVETRRLRELADEGILSGPTDLVDSHDDALPTRQRV